MAVSYIYTGCSPRLQHKGNTGVMLSSKTDAAHFKRTSQEIPQKHYCER